MDLYQLRKANVTRNLEWTGGVGTLADLEFRTIELGGEVGEVLNDVKKFMRFHQGVKGGVDLLDSQIKIANELADVIICVDRVAEVLGINLTGAVIKKFNETSVKHGFKTMLPKE